MSSGSVYITQYCSPLGPVTIASDGEAITGLWFDGQKYDRAGLSREAVLGKDIPVLLEAEAWLDAYFAGRKQEQLPPLHPEGSPFRREVWNILLSIPYGKTMTYGEIARKMENADRKRVSPQAVGGAVGHNPISILIPCHRVIGADGSLTGYAGGMEKKQYLLGLEGSLPADEKIG